MKKYFLALIISFLLLLPINSKAATKEEVLEYISSTQAQICDSGTSGLFGVYQSLISRMLEQKDLSSSDLDRVLARLKDAFFIATQNNICKISDINNLDAVTKQQLKDRLYDALAIINEAPSVSGDSGDSGIVIDKNNGTVDIYEDGVLYDKLELSKKEFNYVGPNKAILITIIILFLILVASTSTYYLLKNKNNKFQRLICDICFSLSLVTVLVLPCFYLYSEQISKLLNYANMLKKPVSSTENKEIVIDENHKITSYPAYGNTYGKLKISNLSIDLPIKFGDSKDILVDSIGHTSSSSFPGEGSTILLSGHNSKDMLGNLKNISKGNKIIIETNYGTFIYEVEKAEIMKTDEYNKLNLFSDSEILILYTCYPFDGVLYGNQRYVITSKLIKDDWR